MFSPAWSDALVPTGEHSAPIGRQSFVLVLTSGQYFSLSPTGEQYFALAPTGGQKFAVAQTDGQYVL